MNKTVIKISDKAQPKENQFKPIKKCSRCNELVKKEKVVLKAMFERHDRQRGHIYIYHPECLETRTINLILNWLVFWYKWKRERIFKKSILKNFTKHS